MENRFSGKCPFAKCTFWKVYVQENVISGKCTLREMYILASVRSGKCTFGIMSIQLSVFRGNVLSGKCFSERCTGSHNSQQIIFQGKNVSVIESWILNFSRITMYIFVDEHFLFKTLFIGVVNEAKVLKNNKLHG